MDSTRQLQVCIDGYEAKSENTILQDETDQEENEECSDDDDDDDEDDWSRSSSDSMHFCSIVPIQDDDDDMNDNDISNSEHHNTISSTTHFLMYMVGERNPLGIIKWLNRAQQNRRIIKLQFEDIEISTDVTKALVELLNSRKWRQVIFRTCSFIPSSSDHLQEEGSLQYPNQSHSKRQRQEQSQNLHDKQQNEQTVGQCPKNGLPKQQDEFQGIHKKECDLLTPKKSLAVPQRNGQKVIPFSKEMACAQLACALAEQVKEVHVHGKLASNRYGCSIPLDMLVLGKFQESLQELLTVQQLLCSTKTPPRLTSLRLLQHFDCQQSYLLGLGIQHSRTIREVDVSFSRFSKESLSALAHHIGLQKSQNPLSNLRLLDFQWCLLEDCQVMELCHAISGHSSLEVLNLCTNRCGHSKECMEALASVIVQNQSFRELDLSDQRYGTAISSSSSTILAPSRQGRRINIQALKDALIAQTTTRTASSNVDTMPWLDTLHLHSNHLRDDDIVSIATAFLHGSENSTTACRPCCPLRVLHLSGNYVTTDGAKTLAMALKYNRTCQSLCLSNNPIGIEGIRALATMVEQSNYEMQHLWISSPMQKRRLLWLPSRTSVASTNPVSTSSVSRSLHSPDEDIFSYYRDRIRFYTYLNKAGRRLLWHQDSHPDVSSTEQQLQGEESPPVSDHMSKGVLPLAIWPLVFERVNVRMEILGVMTSRAPIEDGNVDSVLSSTIVTTTRESTRTAILYYLLRQCPVLLHRI